MKLIYQKKLHLDFEMIAGKYLSTAEKLLEQVKEIEQFK